MKVKEILSRITGISTPIFGISWTPSKLESEIVKKMMLFFEDRRVLYHPYELEDPQHCVDSVLEIRSFLSKQLENLDLNSDLSKMIRTLRMTCRYFLNSVDPKMARGFGSYATCIFFPSLGHLRGIFGVYISIIATRYGVDVPDELSRILPRPIKNEDIPDRFENEL